jgi:dihydropyrimidinase
MSFDLIVRGGTVVFPLQGLRRADIAISGGSIAAILAPGNSAEAAKIIDATGRHVFPGLVEAHLHFGFGEPISEYTTETTYAAQGGFTSVVSYLLSSSSYSGIFDRENAYARERAFVDYAFHFSTASETHLQEMERYVGDYGVTSFKYFMNFKGEEGRYMGLDGTDDGFFYHLLKRAGALKDVVIVCHTENIEIVWRMRRQFQAAGRNTLRDWCESKPDFTEAESIIRAAYFAEKTGARIYIPHLSIALGLEEVRRWRERYPHIYLETCPHYLTHTMDDDLGSLGKANPPLRARADVEALWSGLADGTIEVVAADHVPRKRATKDKPIWQASQGFPGTATILPVLLSEGYHKRGLPLQRIAQVLTCNPARIFGLSRRKGDILVGADGDLTIVDLERVREVRAAELGSYSDYSLYEGWKLKGWPTHTIVRGTVVMEHGKMGGPAGHGKYLRRPL